MWTRFMDMHSGGGLKEDFEYLYIEAPLDEAKTIFYNRFGHNPERVTCTCCGEDYSIDESENLEQATAFERGCSYAYFRPDGSECSQEEAWRPGVGLTKGYTSGYAERADTKYSFSKEYVTLEQYMESKHVQFIREGEIKPHERNGEVPDQGYVWV